MTMTVVHGHDRWMRTTVWQAVWAMTAAACQTRWRSFLGFGDGEDTFESG
jgi:hypothetical protein